MSRKLLIADDEASIQRGLCDIIPWSTLGYQLCGVLANGQEVLDFLEKAKYSIELLLLDINMPLINGKELVAILNERFPELVVIIISSSNELEDIKSTLMNGANDYLHKPTINQKKMVATLAKHCPTPELLASLEAQPTVDETLVPLHDSFNYPYYYAILLDSSEFFVKNEIETQLKTIQKKTASRYQVSTQNEFTIFLLNSEKKLKLGNHMNTNQPVIYTNATDDSELLQQTISKIQQVKTDFSFYLSSYHLCWDFKWNRHDTHYIQQKQQQLDLAKQQNQPLIERLALLKKEINTQQFFMTPKHDLISFMTNCCINLLNEIEKNKKTSLSFEKLEIMKKLASCQAYPELITVMNDFIEQHQPKEELVVFNDESIKEKIEQFIEEHYQQAIDLRLIAEKFNFSYNYFSNLFVTLFDQKFTDYLNGIRLREAKKLLTETKYSMVEICQLVGYSDTTYFSKVFKKNIGMSPNTYRRNFYEK